MPLCSFPKIFCLTRILKILKIVTPLRGYTVRVPLVGIPQYASITA